MLAESPDSYAASLVAQGVPKETAKTFVQVNGPYIGTMDLGPLGSGPAYQPGEDGNKPQAPAGSNTPSGPTIGTSTLMPPTGGAPNGVAPPPSTGPNGPGGGDTGKTTAQAPISWKMYLADWGFDADIINELDRIFRVYSDPNQASAAALAYIRGTDWYARNFAGIGEGIKKGLFADEAGYRNYLNQANQYYQRFYGRDISTNELVDFLNKGFTAVNIGQRLTGKAQVDTAKPDIQFALGGFSDNTTQATDDQLAGYGDTLGGLDNLVGTQLQAKLAKAQARLAAVVQGTLATPALSILKSGNLGSPSLAGGTTPGDVAS